MKIESGTGNGFYAAVDTENRLRVAAVSLPRQHVVSKKDQKNFQIIGEATAANGTVNVLHIKNGTADQTFTVTYIRVNSIDLAGGTAIPAATEFFEVGGGLEYTSGGTSTTSVNTYLGSSTVSGGTYYESNPTLSGTYKTLDKYFPSGDGQEQSYSKEGALIIPPGQTMTIRYTGTNTSGTLYARVSFFVSSVDELDT